MSVYIEKQFKDGNKLNNKIIGSFYRETPIKNFFLISVIIAA
jgi:hypothetical protein